jgi:hypothetical protein
LNSLTKLCFRTKLKGAVFPPLQMAALTYLEIECVEFDMKKWTLPSLKTLRLFLSGGQIFFDQIVSSHLGQQLVHLTLSPAGISSQGYEAIQCLPNLEVLGLYNGDYSARGLPDLLSKRCGNLAELRLEKFFFPDGSLQRMSSNLTRLSHLSLKHPVGPGLADLCALTSLRELCLTNAPVFDFQFSVLSARLEELSLQHLTLTPTSANEVGDLVNLRQLTFHKVNCLSWDEVDSYSRFSRLEPISTFETNMTPHQRQRIAGSLLKGPS